MQYCDMRYAILWLARHAIFNRPGVAGAVLQTSPVTDWVSQRSFSYKSSKHRKSQINRARDLKFLYTMFITCHMSCAACHMSPVTCHVSRVMCNFDNLDLSQRWNLQDIATIRTSREIQCLPYVILVQKLQLSKLMDCKWVAFAYWWN